MSDSAGTAAQIKAFEIARELASASHFRDGEATVRITCREGLTKDDLALASVALAKMVAWMFAESDMPANAWAECMAHVAAHAEVDR